MNCGTRCGGRPSGSKRNPKVIMEEEGDLYVVESDWPSYQTFTIGPQPGETYRGVFYPDNKQSYVHCNRHENLEDLFSTCNHEAIHAAIWECIWEEWREMWNDNMVEKDTIKTDDRKEHNAIRIMLMADLYFGN
jgi:hypothetical protein